MTTETGKPIPVLNTVKEAFAPVTEALKNFQNMEVPRLPASSSRRLPAPPRSVLLTCMQGRRRLLP